ncbi:MAG: DNA mismatch repair endonuclease MutH [Gammaproteobacteria bacterium]|nr:DNA mismatch repair endonuclease MutH [Gammaproteobacteria bacterium]
MSIAPPRDEAELVSRARRWAGMTVGDMAQAVAQAVPRDLRHHKGWLGELVETALGATASSRPLPDFTELGIELKTIPVGVDGKPRESTHVCSVELGELIGQHWQRSTVRLKLSRVLWMPVEYRAELPLAARRFGVAQLWSPSHEQENVLRADWEEHMELLATGRFDLLDARLGQALQIRPKAANGRALRAVGDSGGAPAATLPRGFYLRAGFTHTVLNATRQP